MKTKLVIAALLGLAVFCWSFWGFSPKPADVIAKKRPNILETIDKEKKGKRRLVTRFAYKSLDSIKANQMLLVR